MVTFSSPKRVNRQNYRPARNRRRARSRSRVNARAQARSPKRHTVATNHKVNCENLVTLQQGMSTPDGEFLEWTKIQWGSRSRLVTLEMEWKKPPSSGATFRTHQRSLRSCRPR